MGEDTGIQWTDHTFNPWWGCVKVSPGCRKCYAETLADRYGHDVWGAKKPRRFLSDAYWRGPLKWNEQAAAGVPGVRGAGNHLVFCASMADVFEDYRGPDAERLVDERGRLFDLIAATPKLDWQLLTKRPENVQRLAPWGNDWPANVWIGASVESQRFVDERVSQLLRIPAVVRFLSIEPMLGPVDLSRWFPPGGRDIVCCPRCEGQRWHGYGPCGVCGALPQVVNWAIVGGESGGNHRPFDPTWAEDVLALTRRFDVAFFFKQHGGLTPKAGGRELVGRTWDEFPR